MLKIDYFRYVIEIAKAGTINKAADRLFVSQPYLSLELKNLEHKLGIQLFSRSNKGITLTQAGEKFLSYANEIYRLVEQAEHIKDLYSTELETLTISSMYSFTILDIYSEFSKQATKLEHITYEEVPNEEIPDKVYRGASHVGLLYMYAHQMEYTRQNYLSRGLNFIPLINEPLCAVFNRSHPLASHPSICEEELSSYSLILENPKTGEKDSSVRNIIYPLINTFKMTKPIYFDNNRSLLYYITKNADCYTVGQKSLNITNPFVVSGELVYVPIDGLQDTLVTGYVFNENIPSTNLQERFIDYLEEYFARYNAESDITLVI